MTKSDHLPELDDPILQELRQRVQNAQPYEPHPWEPDYLTPAQIAWIRAGDDEDDG